jgi:tetratricopeptide (TPR) repeat protein
MAKKKRPAAGKQGKGRKRPRPAAETFPEVPDQRVMERMMQQLFGPAVGAPEEGPQAQAQDLLQQAYQEGDETRRVELARQALALCPDCADAYVLLAEHAHSPKEAIELYEKGMAVAERALGEETFRESAGHFWGILETRPYMRARLGLALALWSAGRRDEAVGHLQEMLRLNPGDNQGVRYTLAGFLLHLERNDDLDRLLEQYPDEGSAFWAYTRALLAFRRQGDTPATRKLLQQAKKVNKHVLTYLLGEQFPPEPPPFYSPGDPSEAVHYLAGAMGAWKDTPGAVAWVREATKSKRRKASQPPAPQGPLPLIKERLKRLPQGSDVWQAGVRQLPVWVKVGGRPVRPWLLLVTSLSDDLILAQDLLEEPPTADLVWDKLADAMQSPLAGEPHRPATLQVLAGEPWETLKPHLNDVGVNRETAAELQQVDAIYEGLARHLGGEDQPGLLDSPGVTPELVGRFYEAAAAFFRQAPWRKVGYESALRVECDKFPGGPWYAVLMGQSGLAAGLAVYDDLGTLRRLWSGHLSDEENAELTAGISVIFGEEEDIALGDLEAARSHGWPVARPDAYPNVFRKERGRSMRPPVAWELELMEGCLRAVPDFVRRHTQDDPTREEVTVPVASGDLRLGLSWVTEE